MRWSVLWLVAIIFTSVDTSAKWIVGDRARVKAESFQKNSGGVDLPDRPVDGTPLPLMYAEEKEGEEDDLAIVPDVLFFCRYRFSSFVIPWIPLPSPCPVLSSGAARSPPSA